MQIWLKITIAILLTSSTLLADLSRTKILMGTFATVTLAQEDAKHFKNTFAVIKDVENSLSSYKKSSYIYRLNEQKKLTVDSITKEALQKSIIYYQQTDGYFDISIGSITKKLYRFGEDEQLPDSKQLQNAYVDAMQIKIDKNSVTIAQNMTLDLGGMGKGFGVDKAREYLQSKGVQKAVVALSGDIVCLGECFINITNPFHKHRSFLSFKTLSLRTAISTSGDYERYVGDKKHNHLIDPKSYKSEDDFASVSLISHLNSSDLDAYATAVSVMGKDKAIKWLKDKQIAYVMILKDKKIIISDNIFEFVKDLRYSLDL